MLNILIRMSMILFSPKCKRLRVYMNRHEHIHVYIFIHLDTYTHTRHYTHHINTLFTRLAASRLDNIFGNGTIYRHDKKVEKGKNPRKKLSAKRSDERRRRDRASKFRRHKKRVDLSTLPEIKSHDVILARTVPSQRSCQVSLKGRSKA